jgi:hypothetical protein
MPRTYASRSVKLKAAILPAETLTAIGQLVRACAEIEDLVTLYISDLTSMDVGQTIVLLGRTASRNRLSVAEYLAGQLGKSKLHKSIFNNAFEEIIACRNVVAHGTLLGMTPSGKFAFLSAKTLRPTDDAVLQAAFAYSPSEIAFSAKSAERKTAQIETRLKLQALRQKRLEQPLGAHPNSPRQRRSKTKQKRQPKSSRP